MYNDRLLMSSAFCGIMDASSTEQIVPAFYVERNQSEYSQFVDDFGLSCDTQTSTVGLENMATRYNNIPTIVDNVSDNDIEEINSAEMRLCDVTRDDVTSSIDRMAQPGAKYGHRPITSKSKCTHSNESSEPLFQQTYVSSTGNTDSLNLPPCLDSDDAKLKEAEEEAENGNFHPLIKQELKYTIQTKRLKEGKGELKVEFNEPIPDVLTPEEEEKVEKRRVQNREAARRFRDRQKNKGSQLQKECQRLEGITTELRYELTKVIKERDELRNKLEAHLQAAVDDAFVIFDGTQVNLAEMDDAFREITKQPRWSMPVS